MERIINNYEVMQSILDLLSKELLEPPDYDIKDLMK